MLPKNGLYAGLFSCLLILMLGSNYTPLQAATETPIPTPTQRYYNRSDLMNDLGVIPYPQLTIVPSLHDAITGKIPDIASGGGRWFKTFMFLSAESGALQLVFYMLVMLFVAWFLIALLHRIGTGKTMTSLREAIQAREERVKTSLGHHRTLSGAFEHGKYAYTRVGQRRSARSFHYRGARTRYRG
jgi:hypothetical protein